MADSRRAVIAEGRPTEDLPFVPTVLCLWGAGWVTSLVTSFLFVGHAYPTGGSPTVLVGINLLVSAAVGAVVVRQLLLNVVDCDISYSAVLVALVAGSTASTIVRLIVFSQLTTSGSSALPIAGVGVSFVPAMIGALVSFWLLQNAARSEQGGDSPTLPDARATEHLEATVPASELHRPTGDYGELVSAIRESTLGLVAAVDTAEPSSVPSVVSDGVLGLEAARKRLQQMSPPSEVPAELPQRLAAGMKQLEEDLILTAQDAATAAADRMYQRGLLGPSLADVSDGGGRYRWELEQSEGLRVVRQALGELETLGFGPSQ
jgi:hypothetical protein